MKRSLLTGLALLTLACEPLPQDDPNRRTYEAHNVILTARQPNEYEHFRTLELSIRRVNTEGADASASLKCAYVLNDSTGTWVGEQLEVSTPIQQTSPAYELQLANRDDIERETCDTLTRHPKLDWSVYVWDRTVIHDIKSATTTYGRRNIERVN